MRATVSEGGCPVTCLGEHVVAGYDLSAISLLRLDLLGGAAPGNKWFKLQPYLARARDLGVTRLASFGGPWSNHLHALAAVGAEQGLHTVGLVRGEHRDTPSTMLRDAAGSGMELHYLSRADYRRRADPGFIAELERRFWPCLVIPEGGAGAPGMRGCETIAGLVPDRDWPLMAVACGTGTTLAGLAAATTSRSASLLGVSVLKGHAGLDNDIRRLLGDRQARVPWRTEHRFHCGGYAQVDEQLKAFLLDFEAAYQVQLDPVYTGKLLFALAKMSAAGELPPGPVLALHTGGLQGRRGYDWLAGG